MRSRCHGHLLLSLPWARRGGAMPRKGHPQEESGVNQKGPRKCFRRIGWEAGIRTPIRRSRVCSPTVRRPPKIITYITIAGDFSPFSGGGVLVSFEPYGRPRRHVIPAQAGIQYTRRSVPKVCGVDSRPAGMTTAWSGYVWDGPSRRRIHLMACWTR